MIAVHFAERIDRAAVVEPLHNMMDMIIFNVVSLAHTRLGPLREALLQRIRKMRGCGKIRPSPSPSHTDRGIRNVMNVIMNDGKVLHIARDHGCGTAVIKACIVDMTIGNGNCANRFPLVIGMRVRKIEAADLYGRACNIRKDTVFRAAVLRTVFKIDTAAAETGKGTADKADLRCRTDTDGRGGLAEVRLTVTVRFSRAPQMQSLPAFGPCTV